MMQAGRRVPLRGLGKKPKTTSHAGLWLDRYITEYQKRGEDAGAGQGRRDQPTPQQKLVDEVAGIREPDAYNAFYRRWKAALAARTRWLAEAQVKGRLVVGLGAESVLETSISLHHTYGVPYIPGSALKGLAASFARQRLDRSVWGVDTSAYKIVFGTTEEAGCITFFDALYVPGTGFNRQPLYPDVITMHHPDYYQQGSAPPADWDSPTPVPFLSATGRYLIALAGPDERPVWDPWVGAAFNILRLALAELGAGAKTSSGYGRMELPLPIVPADWQAPSQQIEEVPLPTPREVVSPQERVEAVKRKLREIGKEPLLNVNAVLPDGSVELEIPGFRPAEAVGLITPDVLEGRQYQPHATARVRIVGPEPRIADDGRVIVDMKPVPRKK
jgi:CRISPR-associated protein Cmr6